MVYDDVTATISGVEYLFRDRKGLPKRQADAVQASLDLMSLYAEQTYPYIEGCGTTPKELKDFLDVEDKREREIRRGDRPERTLDEYKEQFSKRVEEITRRHRTDVKEFVSRITRGRDHVGALYLDQIKIEGTNLGITELSSQATVALDDAEDLQDTTWHTLYADILFYLLRNQFLSTPDDTRTFQIVKIESPDIFDEMLIGTNWLAERVAADPSLRFDTYDTNTQEQDDLGIIRLKSISLRPAR